jgi:hypothetical protein
MNTKKIPPTMAQATAGRGARSDEENFILASGETLQTVETEDYEKSIWKFFQKRSIIEPSQWTNLNM